MVDNELGFPVTPVDPRGVKTRMKVKLHYEKRADGALQVNQIEITEGANGPITVFPDPPAGEGSPPSGPPEISTGEDTTAVAGATPKQSIHFLVSCDVEPPTICIIRVNLDGVGENEVSTYEITHGTQDSLVSFLRDPKWHWRETKREFRKEQQ